MSISFFLFFLCAIYEGERMRRDWFSCCCKKKRKIRRDFFSRRQIFCCTSLSLTQMARMKEIFNFFRVYARIDIWETEWTIGNLASMVLERRNIMNPPVSSLAHRRNVSGTNQEEEGVFSSSSSSLFHWQTPTTPIYNGGGGCMYRRRGFANECFSNLKFGSFVCFFKHKGCCYFGKKRHGHFGKLGYTIPEKGGS